MFRVPSSDVANWGSSSQLRYPTAVNTTCPHCAVRYGFALHPTHAHNAAKQRSQVSTTCPGCGGGVEFFILDADGNQESTWGGSVWLYPSPGIVRGRELAVVLEGRGFPNQLATTYTGAVDCYEHGLWGPAAQNARIVLEGLAGSLLRKEGVEPRKGALLAELLTKLATEVDLARPIHATADVLRQGGNAASHFDEESPIGREFATEMLDLLDVLIEYLVVVPLRVERLQARLQGDPAASDGPDG